MEAVDLAWMAGVIDLKGRIVVKRNKSRATPQIVLAVQCKELAVIRRLGMLTGTNPELMEARPTPDFMRKGCDDHCPEAHVHVTHGGYPAGTMPSTARWTITGVGMAILLAALKPYLQVDREYDEAVEAITANMVHQGQGVGMVRKQIERMKELGWQIPEDFDDLVAPVSPVRVRPERFVTAAEVQDMITSFMEGDTHDLVD